MYSGGKKGRNDFVSKITNKVVSSFLATTVLRPSITFLHTVIHIGQRYFLLPFIKFLREIIVIMGKIFREIDI